MSKNIRPALDPTPLPEEPLPEPEDPIPTPAPPSPDPVRKLRIAVEI